MKRIKNNDPHEGGQQAKTNICERGSNFKINKFWEPLQATNDLNKNLNKGKQIMQQQQQRFNNETCLF